MEIEIEQAERPYETVGEAVRAEIIEEIQKMLVWSTDNSLDKETVAMNKAIYAILDKLKSSGV